MHLHYIDLAIVIGSLVLTLLIGLWAGRGVNNVKEYIIGDRRFSTAALIMSFLATNVGLTMVISSTGRLFSQGLVYLIACCTAPIQFFIITRYIY